MSRAQVTLTVEEQALLFAEDLSKRLRKDPAFRGYRITRASVLRQAVLIGLDVLAERHGLPRPGGDEEEDDE